jgi:hypothetical protein
MTQGTALPVKKRKPIGEGEIMRRKQWEAEMCRLPGIFIPVQTVNELNAHTHWRVRQKRAAAQRPRAKRAVQSYRIAHPIELPVSVRFTRYSPGTLDPADGLPSAFKHIIDGMADAFGVDDKSPLYHWLPPIQVKAKYYAVRIELTSL